MDPGRRRFLTALAALPAGYLGARLGQAAEPEPPPRKPRILEAPITLKSGDRIENLDLRLAPDFRWKTSFAVIFGRDVQDVVIRNVTIEGPSQWQARWNAERVPEDAPPGVPTQLCGIRLQRVKNATLEKLRIEGLPRYAITGFGYDDCVIREIDITRCLVGISITHYQPNHRLLVEKVRVHDNWGPAPGLWPSRKSGSPSKLRPGTWTGGDGIVLDSVREGILRDCDVRGEQFGSFKLVNPMDVEAYRLEGMNFMVQGTADLDWKIHQEPAQKIRIHDCLFHKNRGTGVLREMGNTLQMSWHVRELDIQRCRLNGDGQGGHGIQLAVDAHGRVADCRFEDFNGMRNGEPCYAADVRADSSLNADFEQRNTFINQKRIAWRHKA